MHQTQYENIFSSSFSTWIVSQSVILSVPLASGLDEHVNMGCIMLGQHNSEPSCVIACRLSLVCRPTELQRPLLQRALQLALQKRPHHLPLWLNLPSSGPAGMPSGLNASSTQRQTKWQSNNKLPRGRQSQTKSKQKNTTLSSTAANKKTWAFYPDEDPCRMTP